MDSPPRRVRVRWWPPVAVALVLITLLTAGWLLLARTLPDGAPVATGTRFELAGTVTSGYLIAGPGWQVSTGASIAKRRYVFSRADLVLQMFAVHLPPSPAVDVWTGLGKVARIGGGTVGPPRTVVTIDGVPGQAGVFAQDGKTGTATAFVSPDGAFAVETVSAGPAGTAPADRFAAEEFVGSLVFGPPS